MIAATVKRWIWYVAFAWANDGLTAGLRLFGTSAAFAKSRERRWWIQVLPVPVGYVAFESENLESEMRSNTAEYLP